jgi:hypothetical protein
VREVCLEIVANDQFRHPYVVQQKLHATFKGREAVMLSFAEIQRIVYEMRSNNKFEDEDSLTKFKNTRDEIFFWFAYKEDADFAYAF